MVQFMDSRNTKSAEKDFKVPQPSLLKYIQTGKKWGNLENLEKQRCQDFKPD